MRKRDRHTTLLQLIEGGRASSQSGIASMLSAAGFTVTQASVSRDLDELGIVKVNGKYELPSRASVISEFGSVDLYTAGENLIVGKCSSGLASAITVRIDAASLPEIVGTIAGDDTIFIAVKDADAQQLAMQKISEMFG